LSGKWRIVEMVWDKDFLDMLEPTYIAFDGRGSGEFLFGCVIAGLDCVDASDSVDFTWSGPTKWTRQAATARLNSRPMAR
jgi:hypothetical protein